MRLDCETYHEIRRLKQVEHLTAVEIAAQYGVSERTVRKWLALADPPDEASTRNRKSALDAHEERLLKLADEYGGSATRMLLRLQELGISTSLRSIQRWLASHGAEARRREIFNELSFEPGEAAQTDFGSCGILTFDGVPRRLSVCVTVLCHSRLMYAEFIPCERQEHFLFSQRHAFEAFGGAPRKLIVDNCRCAVLRHGPMQVTWNPGFLAFCGHYSVKPVACTPRTPWAKGIVERMVGYIKSNLCGGRQFYSLEEANAVLHDWLDTVANSRFHKSTRCVPRELFAKSEKNTLLPLPSCPFQCLRTEIRIPDHYGRVEFDRNHYSLPERSAGHTVTLKASPDEIMLYDAGELVARHARCYSSGKVISLPEHTENVRRRLPAARRQNARADFLAIGADAATFLKALEERMADVTSELLKLLALRAMSGNDAFRRALHEAVEHGAFRAAYLEHLLTRPGTPLAPAPLRIPTAGDLMELKTPSTDMDIYKRGE